MKCQKTNERENPRVAWRKNGRIMLLSKCALCDSKLKFIIKQEASGSWSSLRIKTPLNKILLLGLLLL